MAPRATSRVSRRSTYRKGRRGKAPRLIYRPGAFQVEFCRRKLLVLVGVRLAFASLGTRADTQTSTREVGMNRQSRATSCEAASARSQLAYSEIASPRHAPPSPGQAGAEVRPAQPFSSETGMHRRATWSSGSLEFLLPRPPPCQYPLALVSNSGSEERAHGQIISFIFAPLSPLEPLEVLPERCSLRELTGPDDALQVDAAFPNFHQAQWRASLQLKQVRIALLPAKWCATGPFFFSQFLVPLRAAHSVSPSAVLS